MDKKLQINRNYYLNALGYINATQILLNGYKSGGVLDESSSVKTIQIWPLYYLLALSAEMTLKAGLVLHGAKVEDLISRKKGHNLDWLLEEYIKIVSSVDANLKWMINALNKGEFRYTEFYGEGAYVSIIDHDNFLNLLRPVLQKDHTEALNRINDATN